MTPSLQVALLEPDALARTQLALSLVRAGFAVTECADIPTLYEALDAHGSLANAPPGPVPVVYVRQAAYSPAMLAGLLPHLRAVYRVAVVAGVDHAVALSSSGSIAGVDHCIDAARAADLLPKLDAGRLRRTFIANGGGAAQAAGEPAPANDAPPAGVCPPPVLAEPANSPALRGDHPHPVDAYGTWKVAHKGWVIINPRGDYIALTGVERNFFEALLCSERHELSRDALDPEQCGFALDSMSVLVSRLRKKVGADGCPLPLHTVHGLGYVFIGSLVRVHNAPPAPLRPLAPPAA